jgi:hypothetical protein
MQKCLLAGQTGSSGPGPPEQEQVFRLGEVEVPLPVIPTKQSPGKEGEWTGVVGEPGPC